MEKNCLVTKYKATVNDNSLLKIGEMRLIVGASTGKGYSRSINFITYPCVIETLDGSLSLTFDRNLLTGFTNKLTLDTDNHYFYANKDVVIVVSNKYDLTGVMGEKIEINLDELKASNNLTMLEKVFCKGSLGSIKDKPVTFLSSLKFEKEQDIINLSGLTTLTYLAMRDNHVSGDISALSRLSALTYLGLRDTSVSGDISALSGLTVLTNLDFFKTSVSGDISSLSGLTSLQNITLAYSSVSGDISSLSGLTSLTGINLAYTSVSGNIQSLGSLTSLTDMELLGMSNITGEIIDYVISQRVHGRNTGTTHFGPSNTVTFNGKVLSDYCNISWTSSTITNETTSETVNR